MSAISIEIGRTARQLFRWWISELSGLMPDALAQRLFGVGNRLVLDLTGPEWVIFRMAGGRHKPLVPVARQETSHGADAVTDRRRLRGLGFAGRDVELRVPGRDLLTWPLVLPMSAGADMRAAIAFQIDRKTPFGPEQTYFDYRIIRRDAAARQIAVEVAVIPRAVAGPLIDRASALDLVPRAIVAKSEDASSPRVEIPTPSAKKSRWRAPMWGLVATAAIMAGALVYHSLAQRERLILRLTADLNAAKAEAEKTLQLRQSLEHLQDAKALLTERKRDTPPVTGTLDVLTRLLPDDVWLIQFSLSGNNAQAAGYAMAASALIGLIDGAEHFSAPRYLSAVTLDTTIGLERFNLAFTVGNPP